MKTMQTMTITTAQAAVLDGDDESEAHALRRELMDAARQRAAQTGETVEVTHPDGHVIEAVEA